jgi:hypothetical protein
MLIKALGLQYGETYGGSWFSSNMELFLNNIFSYFQTSIYSFRQLYQRCEDPLVYSKEVHGQKQDWSNARHLHMEVNRLASCEALNVTRKSHPNQPELFENAIDAADVLSRPQVVYFYLSSVSEEVTTRNIPKLMLYAMLQVADMIATIHSTPAEGSAARGTAADYWPRAVPVIVLLDEFQQLVSDNMLLVLNQARSMNIGCVLAHQNLGQLNLGEKDLTNTVLSNAAYKHFFRATDLATRDYLTKSSGTKVDHEVSWRQVAPVAGSSLDRAYLGVEWAERDMLLDAIINVREVQTPRLEPNEVICWSALEHTSFVNFTREAGLTRYGGFWVPLLSGYHIEQAENERRKICPFPTGDERTVVVPVWTEHDERARKRRAAESRLPRSVSTTKTEEEGSTIQEFFRRRHERGGKGS